MQHTAAAARAAARAESVAIMRSPPAVRTADGKSCRTVSTQSTHLSTRGTSEGPSVRIADGQSCRTVSTQSTHVSTRGTSEGPVVRIADGRSCHTAAQCGAPTHCGTRHRCMGRCTRNDCAAKSAAAVPRGVLAAYHVPTAARPLRQCCPQRTGTARQQTKPQPAPPCQVAPGY